MGTRTSERKRGPQVGPFGAGCNLVVGRGGGKNVNECSALTRCIRRLDREEELGPQSAMFSN